MYTFSNFNSTNFYHTFNDIILVNNFLINSNLYAINCNFSNWLFNPILVIVQLYWTQSIFVKNVLWICNKYFVTKLDCGAMVINNVFILHMFNWLCIFLEPFISRVFNNKNINLLFKYVSFVFIHYIFKTVVDILAGNHNNYT